MADNSGLYNNNYYMGVREISVGDKRLVVHELEHVCDPVTGRVLTGSWVWHSALVLSEWMTAHSHRQPEYDLKGKTVLELGAGAAGLPGLTAAMLGASRVVLTDIDPLIPALSRNVEANGLDNVVQDEMGALAKTLKGACGEHTKVWAATEMRPLTGECLSVLVGEGFGVVELPCPDQRSDSFVVFCLVPLSETGHVSPAFHNVCCS